ncbi:hypothetical protein B0H17DRAFT_1120606 [Mycena rosella]|uniref:DUF6535 domain-containing protein n=1 Tax=Mycena rosella TaxID=1033263 RepID=A0AAD7AYW9_MYCRO|nr:hypothetical protein B0H17DRAFT_1120606 [Mycena rosella]
MDGDSSKRFVAENHTVPPLLDSPRGSAFSATTHNFANLTQLIAEQTELLRSIEARQASADLSRKPMPQVPATSSSAWNPLLKSFVAETIQPKVDRWRNGLDSLLVFLGLFSAIVTAFLVDSMSSLKQDQTARTNELIVNLTDILVLLIDRSSSNLTFSKPSPFEPDPSDIRVNSFYSLSLVLSLSIAALVVAGRGFLNMVTWSPHKKAAVRLSDIHKRWAAAERILRPTIESIPQLLVIPVLLFIAGIMDVLLSTVLQISPRPTLIFVTTSLCLASIITVASVLLAAFIDGGLNPSTSPFQSSLASLLRAGMIIAASILSRRSHYAFSVLRASPSEHSGDPEKQLSDPSDNATLSADVVRSYHEIVQDTHDDDALDLAASALLDILKGSGFSRRVDITETERATFTHLLSPEASIRSNRTAAEVFAATYGDAFWISQDNRLFDTAHPLLDPFLDALQRYNRDYSGLSFASMWDSPFTLALAVVVGYQTGPIHPVVYIASAPALNWESWSAHPGSIATKEKILRLVWKVLDIKLTKLYLQDIDIFSRREQMHSLIYTSTSKDWVKVDSRALFESLVFLFDHGNLDQYLWITDFVQWIAEWASLDVLILDVLRILRGDMLEQRWVTPTMRHNFFTCIELILNACAARPDLLSGNQTLNLCMLCTSNALRCIEAFMSPLDSLEFVTNFPRTLAIARCAMSSVQLQMLPPALRTEHRVQLFRILADVVKIKQWMDQLGDYTGKSQIEDEIQVILQHIEAEKAAIGEGLYGILSAETVAGITLPRPLRYTSFTRAKWITEQGIRYGRVPTPVRKLSSESREPRLSPVGRATILAV